MDETRESMSNWFDTAQTFFSRDDSFARFVQPAAVWNRDAPNGNYGFVNEEQNTKLRRTAVEVAAALDRFFRAMAGFFPVNFLIRRFEGSTSFASMKEIVYVAWNLVLVTGAWPGVWHVVLSVQAASQPTHTEHCQSGISEIYRLPPTERHCC